RARTAIRHGIVGARSPRAVDEMATRLQAASPGELPGLEAFLAEHGTPLRRLEGHRRFLAAVRAGGHGLDPLPHGAAGPGRPRGAFGFAGLAAFGFVLEVLVGEELLLPRRPYELRATIHAPEDPILELHRSLPRRGRSVVDPATPARAGASCDYACARAPVSLAVCHRVSDRRSAS